MPRAPCSRKPTRTPHAVRNRKDGGQSYYSGWILMRFWSKGQQNTSCNAPAAFEWLRILVGPADSDPFVRIENTASCNCSTTYWLSPTVWACLCCRPLIDTYETCLPSLCRTDCTVILCCAVRAVGARRPRTHVKKRPTKKMKNNPDKSKSKSGNRKTIKGNKKQKKTNKNPKVIEKE